MLCLLKEMIGARSQGLAFAKLEPVAFDVASHRGGNLYYLIGSLRHSVGDVGSELALSNEKAPPSGRKRGSKVAARQISSGSDQLRDGAVNAATGRRFAPSR